MKFDIENMPKAPNLIKIIAHFIKEIITFSVSGGIKSP